MLFKLAQTVSSSWSELASSRVVAIAKWLTVASFAPIAVTSLILGVRYLGGLQPLELIAFDQFVRLRPEETKPDPRILVITITEADIQRQKQWPISDRVLAQLLRKLQALQPEVIGLDLYRNIPIQPGHNELVAQLKQPNLIAIQSLTTLGGTVAPPEVSANQIGFNELPIDPDDVVRRNILFAEGETGVLYSFSLRLALAYLQQQGIEPQNSPGEPSYLQLGPAVFEKLREDSGGYQTAEADGYQILLNYRGSKKVAREVPLSEALEGRLDPS